MAMKLKHNWQLSRAEAAALLRKLADTLEDESDDLGEYGISLAELVKFKIKVDLVKIPTRCNLCGDAKMVSIAVLVKRSFSSAGIYGSVIVPITIRLPMFLANSPGNFLAMCLRILMKSPQACSLSLIKNRT